MGGGAHRLGRGIDDGVAQQPAEGQPRVSRRAGAAGGGAESDRGHSACGGKRF